MTELPTFPVLTVRTGAARSFESLEDISVTPTSGAKYYGDAVIFDSNIIEWRILMWRPLDATNGLLRRVYLSISLRRRRYELVWQKLGPRDIEYVKSKLLGEIRDEDEYYSEAGVSRRAIKRIKKIQDAIRLFGL